MGAITKFKINNQDLTPPIEWRDLEVEATFDNDSVQANINFSSLNFVNEANEIIKQSFNGSIGATEGLPFEIEISDQNTFVPFKGYLDWKTYTVKSSYQCEIGIVKLNGLNAFNERAKGITMLLLETEGIMPKSLGVNIPYIVKNRKTLLEKIQLLTTAYSTIKTAIDEIFKFINISADLTTLGSAQALINLTQTILSLVVLINKLANNLTEIQKAFFPLVRYHRGITLKTFLKQGCLYMGYTLDLGSFDNYFEKITLCPHKTDEVEGVPVGFLGGALSSFNNNISGILKPSDFGYVLADAFELANKLCNTKVAIIGNSVKLLPFNDPYWSNNPTYTMPDVVIEQTNSYQNGEQTYNLDEFKGRTLISYAQDDSDLWTLTNINDSVSETIVTPVTVNNQRNVLLNGIENIDIPYALCVRNNAVDDLFELFKGLVNLTDEWIAKIKETFDDLSDILTGSLGQNNEYLLAITLREGAMKVENHFFSTPKILYLENGKIPTDYVSKIGAIALYKNFHSYKSFVQGVRNSNNLNDTNQKKLFKNVKIPFGMTSFNQITNNSFFTINGGNFGKFTNVKWAVDRDYAIVDFYVQENYMTNILEVTI